MPRFDSEAARLKRRRELLQAMQKKALNPQRTEVAGGHVVPYSPLEGLSQLGQALIARNSREDLEQDEFNYGQRKADEESAASQKVIEAMIGKPQAGGPLLYDEGQEYQQYEPAIEPDYKKAAMLSVIDPALEESKGLQSVATALMKGDMKGKTGIGSNPYFTALPTSEGYVTFDARKGTYNKPTEPFMRSTDDPQLQADIKGAIEGAKLDVQLDKKPQLEADIVTSKAIAEDAAKGDIRRKDMPLLVQQAKDILTQGTATESGIGTLYDIGAGFFGAAPEGAKEAAQLKSIGGMLTSKAPRMEGPQSDYDVKLYREMAGRIGDSTVPIEIRLQALQTVEDMWMKPPSEAYADYIAKKGKVINFSDMSDDDFLNSEPK